MKEKNFMLAQQLRHELHQHPEMSCQETWTKQHLMDFLKEHTGLELHDGGRYFYAVHRARPENKKRGAIAFRADFDAIPVEDDIDKPYKSCIAGHGHKCGHDGHAASLCGLGLELEDMDTDRDVYMVFQHAEETGQGAAEAKQMLIDNPDIEEIYAYHNQPGVKEGEICISSGAANCASKGMSVFMTGTPTHASQPELGVNPVSALINLAAALPDLADQSKYKGLVLCTVVQLNVGDYAFGVAASRGVLRMTIRAEIEDEMNQLQESIEKLAEKEAKKAGVSLKIEFQDEFPETRNHHESVAKVYAVAEKLGYGVHEIPVIRGSEDFGHFTKLVPGAIMYIGDGEDVPPLHTTAFDFNDSLINYAVEIFKGLIAQ